MKKAIFIYNPFSGNRSNINNLDFVLEYALKHDTYLIPYRIEGLNARLYEILENNEFDFAIISGGDGTLNSIANILLQNKFNLPIGIIPSGTCNDFALSLGIPGNIEKSLDIIFSGNIMEVDVGLINDDKYFLNSCAGGLFVDVSFNTNSELKKNFGPLAYYLKALSEVTHMKSFNLKLNTDTGVIEEDALLFFILNGTYGGGFANLINDADISDGLMDIILIKKCAHIDLANLFFNVLTQESVNNKYALRLKTKQCEIEGYNNVQLSVDGEKGPMLPVKIRFLHRALSVFVKTNT
ncbi:MAG: YegS/Rv2252/BmrU family lipid kinase [Clostridia bacterium]|nr:YegS/Rv2252/BmrU family lipid kinase [Clostridia bacterium]MDD4047673.1 YegS/Rv2252/BmrU family lipid kinase [Clostridia bacterium]